MGQDLNDKLITTVEGELWVAPPANAGRRARDTAVSRSDYFLDSFKSRKGAAQEGSFRIPSNGSGPGDDLHGSSRRKRRALRAEADKLGDVEDEITTSPRGQ